MSDSPKLPRALALVLCDRVEDDPHIPAKKRIIGTFCELRTFDLSIPLPQLVVYADVERGEAEHETFKIDLFDPDGRHLAWGAWKSTGRTNAGDASFVITWTDICFYVPGIHIVRIAHDDRVLLERKLLVTLAGVRDR